MWGRYRLATFRRSYYRPIGCPPLDEGSSVSNINEAIDASVFDHWRNDEIYRPPALQEWAKRRKVDLEAIRASVRADNPAISVAD
jgi:hypothetical protein